MILAANHFSNYDHFLAGAWLRRKIRFLAKSQMFRQNRILDYIYTNGGVFPIRRGHADARRPSRPIHAILRRGGCVMIYCEGGRSRTGELGEAAARRRPRRARERRPGGAGRHPRLAGDPRLDASSASRR